MRKWPFLTFFLILLLLICGGLALLQTSFAKRKLLDWINQQSPIEIQAEKIEGFLPFRVHLEGVTLLQDGAPLLRLLQFSFAPSLSSMTSPRLAFEQIELSLLHEGTLLNIEGSISIEKKTGDWLLPFHATSPTLPSLALRGIAEGHLPDTDIQMIANLETPFGSLAIESLFSDDNFTGSLYGTGTLPGAWKSERSWTLQSDFFLENFESLTLEEFSLSSPLLSLNGGGLLTLQDAHIGFEGLFDQEPFNGYLFYDASNDKVTLTLDGTAFGWKGIEAREGRIFVTISSPFEKPSLEIRGQLDEVETTAFVLHEVHLYGHYSPDSPVSFTFTLPRQPLVGVARGEISGLLQLEGELSNMEGTLSLDVHQLQVPESPFERFPSVDIQIEGHLDRQHLAFHGSLLGIGEIPLQLQGSVPLIFSLYPFGFDVDEKAPLSLSLKGQGPIDPLLAALENADLIARGEIDCNLEVEGSIQDPLVTGFLKLHDGFFESLVTGAVANEITLDVNGQGNALVIEGFQAQDLNKGSLEGGGKIQLSYKDAFPFALEFRASNFQLLTVDPLSAKVDGHFLLSGSLQEAHLYGRAELKEAHLTIPNRLPVQVPVVEMTYVNPSRPNPPPKKKSSFPISWDLELMIPRHLQLDGRGITSEWRGSIHMTGEGDSLSYKGKLKVVNGVFLFGPRRFDLTSGTIQINGVHPKEIFLDVQADLELHALTVSIQLKGPIDSPELTFTSTPSLTPNEILSWVIFNRELNELTPLQACQLAHLLVQLSGTYTGPNLFSEIKEGLGLDVFNISSCDPDTADISFQVGKYLSQGVYVGVNKSISGDDDSLTVQARLFRNFFLQADYGGSFKSQDATTTGKLILKWYKSY